MPRAASLRFISESVHMKRCTGGRSGIRTHERVAPLPVFKTGALNRSAIRPSRQIKHLGAAVKEQMRTLSPDWHRQLFNEHVSFSFKVLAPLTSPTRSVAVPQWIPFRLRSSPATGGRPANSASQFTAVCFAQFALQLRPQGQTVLHRSRKRSPAR